MLREGNVHSAKDWREVLEPVLARYRGLEAPFYFRADAAFANPEIYEFLESEGYGYVLPDGGGGGSTSVVPGYSGGNRAPEIGNGCNWLKMDPRSKRNPGLRGRGVSLIGKKDAPRAKNGYHTVWRLRKPAVEGRNHLVNPLGRETIAGNHPNSP